MTVIIGVVSIALMIAFVAAMVVVQTWASRRPIGSDDAALNVKVGDIWLYVGEASKEWIRRNGLVFVVERANVDTEAGPNSWVMGAVDPKTFEPMNIGKPVYMHLRSRSQDWKALRQRGRLTSYGQSWLTDAK